MSIADIQKIRAAESEAQDIRKKAEDEMAQIIASGKREAKDLIESTRKQSDDAYKAAISAAEKKAADLFADTIAREQETCEKIKNDGRSRMGEVIDDIVGKVVGINGNS